MYAHERRGRGQRPRRAAAAAQRRERAGVCFVDNRQGPFSRSHIPVQMYTQRVPLFYANRIFKPSIYTSTNFDTNHVVGNVSKKTAREKWTSRGVNISTIVNPDKLASAMLANRDALTASTQTGAKVELAIPLGWSNAITDDGTNRVRADKIKVNTRYQNSRYEVYHLDESSINLGLKDRNEFPSLPTKKNKNL